MATIQIKTKTPGNCVNVRKGMSGKAHAEIVKTVPDGEVLEGELSKNGNFYKVDGGYIVSSLCVEIDGEDPVYDEVEYSTEE